MKRNVQIKFNVSKEEKNIIENNAINSGYSSIAAFMRDRCVNIQEQGFFIYQKCEIRNELQEIISLSGNNSKIACHVNRIHDILNRKERKDEC